MPKKIVMLSILTLALVSFLSGAVMAETQIYQKVKRKSVEIVPKETAVEEDTDIDTSEIFTPEAEVQPAKPPVKTPVPVEEEPVVEPVESIVTLPGATASVPSLQLGAKTGLTAPGFGLIGEATMLPVVLSDSTALFTRAGLGYAANDDDKSVIAYLSEMFSYNVQDMPARLYAGAGINYPVLVNNDRTGNLGFDLYAGAEYLTNLFLQQQQEALFVETGLSTFSVADPDDTTSRLSLLLGYKLLFN